jgi:FixJ family two-component response regulator
MPGKVDGWMLGRHALDSDPDARVVYMTGYAEMPAALTDREKFLRKPFTMDKLFSLL